jgi:hypothetical protein
MQVKILTRTMKTKSEHHKVSGSSSAKAHRIRAANLPSHRLRVSEIQRSEVVRSAGGKLSPIRRVLLSQKACFDKRNYHFNRLFFFCRGRGRGCTGPPWRPPESESGGRGLRPAFSSLPPNPRAGHGRAGRAENADVHWQPPPPPSPRPARPPAAH